MAHGSIRIRSACTAVALVSFLASTPGWAPQPVCPTCSIKKAEFTIPWAIADQELVRVCLVGAATEPATAAMVWSLEFVRADGQTALVKQLRVAAEGFDCGDTNSEELRLAGLAPDLLGRIQFGLSIVPDHPVLLSEERPKRIVLGGIPWRSIETINAFTGVVTSSHRSKTDHPDFLWTPTTLIR